MIEKEVDEIRVSSSAGISKRVCLSFSLSSAESIIACIVTRMHDELSCWRQLRLILTKAPVVDVSCHEEPEY
jgi:hypothetical protein